MDNKKGLSDVVTTVLIILIAIIAVAIIGGLVLRQVNNASTKVTDSAICSDLQFEVTKCEYNSTASPANYGAKMIIRRGGQGSALTVSAVYPMFEKADGQTISGVTSITAPAALATAVSTATGASSLAEAALARKAGVAVDVTTEDGRTVKCDYFGQGVKINCVAVK